MNEKKVMKQLQGILLACLGSEQLVEKWWESPNRAFQQKTPREMWEGDDKERNTVKDYILSQASGDYL